MLVSPVLPQEETRIVPGRSPFIANYLAVAFIVSLVGCPVLTLPTPRQTHELPFGIQIIAPPGCEERLFGFGRVVEEKLNFSHRRPVLI
jgi:amidase